MNCIIIDDEATARAIVAQLCSSVDDLQVVGEFDSAIEGIKFLNHQDIDLVFLDIHMPGFSGIDFVQTLQNAPKIVLTTSDPNFAIEAYEYESVIDYLVKPITTERFKKAVKKVRNSIRTIHPGNSDQGEQENRKNDLYINIDRRLIKIEMPSIQVIEAKGDYIEIKTDDTVHRVHTTLKKIREKLPEQQFLQIHRSFIINFDRIVDIEDNSVLIEKQVIPISRSNRPELMRRLNLL
ncbi:LytR/AlgR family response regulator transcription factor [Zeaxanthinibacter enoshimensis]|uniref:DNA-binding LytR/AlgR family response regulator n=1 Tax=Zeaxanthinibacter enoshimensis TaxID=392009 RepID=A0A4R6TMK3_9FLAO|nr:LytTR family DNA-binding domain-containing protein [Zeaxanthinibacter enoshimensis]TDQ31088.1 DNA-binding LytR/AlgR family response regulator [Zeaxanthinibacter enoshimensis]